MSGCLCIHWPGAALSFLRFILRRVQTAAVGLCRGVYVFIGWVQRIMPRRVQTAAVGLCRGVYVFIGWVQRIMLRRVQTAAVGLCRGVYVFIGRVQLCPSSGLCSGVCRQPQWVYVGVFMYSLAGWSRFYGQKYVI